MSTYSAESNGRYSDDFVSDDDRHTPARRSSTPRRRGDGYYQDRLRGGRGRGVISRGRGRGNRGQGRGGLRGRGNSRNSEPADMRRLDNVTTRVMSASRNKINELKNRVEEMKLKLHDLEQENKLYKKLQYRQEKAIRGFEDKENDLPNILDKHNNEVRSLKEQNRRLREKHDKTDRYLRDAEDELERVKKKMLKYKKMCDEKELPEREELARKVTKAELDMEERDVKIRELERHIESLKKNHRHELGIEAARQREVKKQLEEAVEKNTALENTVKEKDKALDYKNIYSNPNRHRSVSRESSPGRSRARGVKSKASSLTDLTPRDKAKFYAEKRRAELLKQKEELEKRRDQEQKDRREREEKEGREKKEREERERKEREERERREREREEQERRARMEREKLDNDPTLIEERRKKDELLRKLQAMDKLGSAGTGNDPSHVSLTPGSLSPSRRSKESSRMGGGDGFDSASKRSDPKEYSFTKPVNNLHKGKPSHEDVTVPYLDRQRQQQGRKPTTLPSGSGENQDDSFGYQPSFGPPGGVRSGGNKGSKPLSIFNDNDDDDVGAFKIPANSSKTTAGANNNKKSSNLLENLFGSQTSSNNNVGKNKEDNKTFFVTGGASPSPISDSSPANRRGNMNNGNSTTTFPWDTATTKANPSAPIHGANKSFFDTSKRDNSSTLFGGGAALIEDDFSSSNGKILPRRRQQANMNTFSSKPSVVAMDNFDDDLEEVVL